jgi:hypothetical protein
MEFKLAAEVIQFGFINGRGFAGGVSQGVFLPRVVQMDKINRLGLKD